MREQLRLRPALGYVKTSVAEGCFDSEEVLAESILCLSLLFC